MNTPRYYQASGSAPVVGLMITLGIGIVGGAILSIVYSAIVYYNPLVYLNLLAGGGFAALCGLLSLVGVSVGKVRNRSLAGGAGAAVGFISLYFAWVSFLYIMLRDLAGQGVMIFDLGDMWTVIRGLGETGWWGFTDNSTVKGFGLYFIWICEAVAIIGISAFLAYAKDTPFCEPCNRWCDERECPATFAVPEDFAVLQASLEGENYAPLHALARPSSDASVFLKAKLYPCSECDDTSWLKLQLVQASLNDKGEVETQETTLINYLDIPRHEYDQLMSLVPGSDIGTESPAAREDAEDAAPDEDDELGD